MTKDSGERQGDLTADREREIVDAVFRLVLAAIFTLPLVGNMVAHALGYEFFLLADSKIQFFWGSIVQFGAGLPFYVGTYKSLRAGGANSDVLVALGTSAAYGYSVYNTFCNPREVRVYFETSAVLLTLAVLGKLVRVIARGHAAETDRRG